MNQVNEATDLEGPGLELAKTPELFSRGDDIRFFIQGGTDQGGTEVLKLAANGDIYVHGRLAANDMEVVDAMREFVRRAGPRE